MVKGKRPRYFQISWDWNRSLNFKITNAGRIQEDHPFISAKVGWPDGVYRLPRHPGRIPDYLETPRFLFRLKAGRKPIDAFPNNGLWAISNEMKSFLESIDPGACAFHKCEAQLSPDDEVRAIWVCSVERVFPVSDVVELEPNPNCRKL
jgi:hypothetical protein